MKVVLALLICLMLSACASNTYNNQTITDRFKDVDHRYKTLDKKLWYHFIRNLHTEKQINLKINSIQYMSDMDNYGQLDYWAAPQEMLEKNAGDCEDYAIAKYYALKHIGYKDKDLRILIVEINTTGQYHAVLLIKNRRIMSNGFDQTMSIAAAKKRYTFLYSINNTSVINLLAPVADHP